MTKIEVDEVARRFNKGEEIVVIDARSEDSWNKSDVKARGALRMPPDAVELHIADVKRDAFVVAYCC